MCIFSEECAENYEQCRIAYKAVIPKGACQHMIILLSIYRIDSAYHTALIWQSIRNREK